ncbi:major facilitator superfamily MFS_1 [Beutenbergia cavernae DSM 12333]|uniref:Major facilitator superfamily MFS_1 n=1 Tax=Beutenbergia cavernae (strain ATCC BAA-8 / DSM 12333 / CCUG 43141 / JCM 11478 / NBRC 16432 / NCIMB 13614 / HKI 0122) TaxID=471853 RepID=C5BX87_BEUC1|nr:MFS transporter [Beutenbergia cavernae]ACQ78762.1 major facilitator superfamily MFS_1 [Beutenbergia cavernae DSM 12333]
MSPRQRRALVVAILAAFVPFLDGAVVNVALPAIETELGGGLVTQQWVVDAYLITLGAFILLAGSLADVYGRIRIMTIGLVLFGATSVLCALAPTAEVLIVARALQGAAGALLVPSSLALIVQEFRGQAQAAAIGTWTAWTSGAFIAGPLIGGVLVDAASWRWVFGINVLPVAVTLILMAALRGGDAVEAGRRIDVLGAALAAVGLGGTVVALIEQARLGWTHPVVWVSLVVGVLSLVGFVVWERRSPDPMLPLALFRARNFAWGNLATFAVYGALGVGSFLLTLFVQQVGNYTATQAGLALLPPTVLLLLLSGWFGRLAGRFGPRLFMTAGPLVAGVGYLLMLGTTAEATYLTQLLPGIVVFGLGLAMTVSPLTAAILGAVEPERAGIGSAVNNAVARVAGLLTVAGAGIVIGSTLDVAAFHRSLVATAVLFGLGGLISWVGIRTPAPAPPPPTEPAPGADSSSA